MRGMVMRLWRCGGLGGYLWRGRGCRRMWGWRLLDVEGMREGMGLMARVRCFGETNGFETGRWSWSAWADGKGLWF